jgi:hypothetical protein
VPTARPRYMLLPCPSCRPVDSTEKLNVRKLNGKTQLEIGWMDRYLERHDSARPASPRQRSKSHAHPARGSSTTLHIYRREVQVTFDSNFETRCHFFQLPLLPPFRRANFSAWQLRRDRQHKKFPNLLIKRPSQ